jgi:hypothetical protein
VALFEQFGNWVAIANQEIRLSVIALTPQTFPIEIGKYPETLSFVPGLPGLFFQQLVYGGALPPPHSLRQAQGCGFPHAQVAKRTAPSRQSLKKRLHGLASHENSR